MNEELGLIISKLRGALYLAQRDRLEEALDDLNHVDEMRAAISWHSVPAVPFRSVVLATLGQIEGNRYLLEYDSLMRSIERAERIEAQEDDEEEGLVNDPLEGLTGSKLLRLALERILEEQKITYKELTGVKARWDPVVQNLELELIVTQRLFTTTA